MSLQIHLKSVCTFAFAAHIRQTTDFSQCDHGKKRTIEMSRRDIETGGQKESRQKVALDKPERVKVGCGPDSSFTLSVLHETDYLSAELRT